MMQDQKAVPEIGEYWTVNSKWGEITARRYDGGSGWVSCENGKDVYQDYSVEPVRKIANNPARAIIDPEDLDPVVCAIMAGLSAAPQHKQYYLEKALRALVMDAWVNEAQKEFEWEKGEQP